jgi:thiol-disulfide isomerase/thioredoxin
VWCTQLEKVAEEYQDKVKIVKIDTDIESDLASSLQVLLLFIRLALQPPRRRPGTPLPARAPRQPLACALVCIAWRSPAEAVFAIPVLQSQEAGRVIFWGIVDLTLLALAERRREARWLGAIHGQG